MNNAQIAGLRKLYSSTSPSGQYGLFDKNGRLIIGWLTIERVKEYSQYYIGATCKSMEVLK